MRNSPPFRSAVYHPINFERWTFLETREEKRQRDRDYYWRNRELIPIKKRNRISRGLIKVSEKEKRSKVVRNQKRRAILKKPSKFLHF